ncbi:MAG: hypothetical protein IK117_02545 [Bacteroidales bacterium]|nr:hypothetical protein [Bacteroidales bacterium]
MKKVFKFTVIALCACLSFSACKKDKGGNDDDEITISKKTVEQNKADLQQAGINLSDELKAMKDGDAFNAILQLANLQKNGELKAYALKSADVESKLKGYEIPDEFAQTISDASGVFEWNAETKEFEQKGELTNAVTYKFPFDASANGNNCEVNAKVDFSSNYKNAPAKVTSTLKINGKECLNFTFTASYTNDGYPNSIVESFKIDDYYCNTEFSRSTSKMSVSISFLHGSKTLLGCSGSVEGDLSDENFDKIMKDDIEDDDAFYASILKKIGYSAQVMNFKFVSSVSMEDLIAIEDDLAKVTSKEDVQKIVDKANNDIDAYVYNMSDNTKIADIKFVVEKEDTRYYVEEMPYPEGDEYTAELRLVFADETSMDFDDYFEKGFEKMEESFNKLLDDYTAALSKYDLD